MATFTMTENNRVLHLKLVAALSALQPGEAIAWEDLPAIPSRRDRTRRIRAAAKAANVYVNIARGGVQRVNPTDNSLLVNLDQRHARALNAARRTAREADTAASFTTPETPSGLHQRIAYVGGVASSVRAMLGQKKAVVVGAGRAPLPLTSEDD